MTAKSLTERSPREMEIIRSAYRMMADRGSHRLTLLDIAQSAGVSKALLLYHFGTKDALLHAAMEWALQRTADRIRQRLQPTTSGSEAISALFDAVFVDPEANRAFYLFYLDLVEHAARVPRFGGLSGMLTEIINGLYAEVIEAGMKDGSFPVGDPQLVARHMRALIEGTFVQWLQTDDWQLSHRLWRDDCQDAIVKLLGAG
ncbi:MAG TPA: TetR/AcrR family transcriptional regulator [Acidimicrobiia bacterium]|nr:TetR/AcrR family transcriptional regulator [Acidimicrobiia bacterium]